MTQRRAATVALSLVVLFGGPLVWGTGPNFKLEITGSTIGVFASLGVSGGSPVYDFQSYQSVHVSDPEGFEIDEYYPATGTGGYLTGTSWSQLLWAPGLDENNFTQNSIAQGVITLDGDTTSTGTASCTGVSASAFCGVDETGIRTSETSWKTSRALCGFQTLIDATVTNGSGGASATVSWGDQAQYMSLMTTWDSTAGFHTEGFFEVDGVDEIIDEEDAAGISGTAQIVIEVKAQAGSGDTDPFELIDHSAVASTGLDFLNNNGVIMVEVHAGTEVSAIGYPQ